MSYDLYHRKGQQNKFQYLRYVKEYNGKCIGVLPGHYDADQWENHGKANQADMPQFDLKPVIEYARAKQPENTR